MGDDLLGELREAEATAARAVERAEAHLAEQMSRLARLAEQVEVEKKAVSHLRAAYCSVQSSSESFRRALEMSLSEVPEAPEVPSDPEPTNVTPIRPETKVAKATATVGIGAAVKRSRARKKKPNPEREKREVLKSTHVSGVMAFSGAEKPPHL